MMRFLLMLLGLALLPACWAAAETLAAVVSQSAGLGVLSLSFLGGIVAFAALWLFAPHPVKTYVLGHELTHAIWGLLFGAKPSRLKVGESGGSVNLTKSNVVITLAPYFFPFYTFIVILAACAVSFFVKPLPALPAWMFAVGFTWAFHLLFTVQSLGLRQPDVQLYGRIFSWAFIFIANVLLVLAGLAFATDYGFARLLSSLWETLVRDYSAVSAFTATAARRIALCIRS